jgi:hypothetical protein
MAHEMGRNTGLGHSARQNSDGSFVTIMAYGSAYGVFSSAGRLQVHSDPDINTCREQPCGIEYTLSDGADAVRSLNLASSQIADYTAPADGPVNNAPVAAFDQFTRQSVPRWRNNIVQSSARYHQALTAQGTPSRWLELPQRGISGNTHMLMMDTNAADIAGIIDGWMFEHGLRG